MQPVNLYDFESMAREKLSKMAYDYYASGANAEITLRKNDSAYDSIFLRYRVMVDISRRNLSTEVLGQKLSLPVMIAPTAFHKLAHPEGELATAKAASSAGSILVLSTLSNTSIEEVTKVSKQPVWFQLYVYKDRGASKALIERAESAGCKALVVTVDAPYTGTRERDVRNRFHLPEGLQVKNLTGSGHSEVPASTEGSGLAAYIGAMMDQTFSWSDIEWLRSTTSLPILIKGVVRGDDAAKAVEHGLDGIVVSNHGGRQLDTSPATIDVLPEIVEAAGGKAEILIDGGIRRGTDIIKALALGAKAVMIGRPALWGLAISGESGVVNVLKLLRKELDLAMALCGCRNTSEITSDLIHPG